MQDAAQNVLSLKMLFEILAFQWAAFDSGVHLDTPRCYLEAVITVVHQKNSSTCANIAGDVQCQMCRCHLLRQALSVPMPVHCYPSSPWRRNPSRRQLAYVRYRVFVI